MSIDVSTSLNLLCNFSLVFASWGLIFNCRFLLPQQTQHFTSKPERKETNKTLEDPNRVIFFKTSKEGWPTRNHLCTCMRENCLHMYGWEINNLHMHWRSVRDQTLRRGWEGISNKSERFMDHWSLAISKESNFY